jgi:hypothetical protein
MLKRAVLFTGSPDSLVDAVSGEVEAVVQKPFKAQDLIDVVRRVSA